MESINGLSDASMAAPTANHTSATTYTVTVTGSNGCTATDDVVVTVNFFNSFWKLWLIVVGQVFFECKWRYKLRESSTGLVRQVANPTVV